MANSFKDRIWTIDTAVEIMVLGRRAKIERLEWSPNAVDNDLLIVDGNDKVIWKVRAKVAGGANQEDIGDHEKVYQGGKWVNGFDVTTIDGGTLYVYIM